MERLQKAAILTELAEQLRREGSWCGHTHMQKAIYFLQEVLGLPTGYEFILYKHGPYSFDLSEELVGLRADYLIEFDHKSPGYGPGLVPTQSSATLRANYPITLAKHLPKIEFIARVFGSKGVAELERLATALYVRRELGATADIDQRANRIHELKPHVNRADALAALREYERIAAEAKSLISAATRD
jgi:uncharacterized protein YwgA